MLCLSSVFGWCLIGKVMVSDDSVASTSCLLFVNLVLISALPAHSTPCLHHLLVIIADCSSTCWPSYEGMSRSKPQRLAAWALQSRPTGQCWTRQEWHLSCRPRRPNNRQKRCLATKLATAYLQAVASHLLPMAGPRCHVTLVAAGVPDVSIRAAYPALLLRTKQCVHHARSQTYEQSFKCVSISQLY